MTFFAPGPLKRILWLKTVVALAFVSGIVLSSKLWFGIRSYPQIPIVEHLSVFLNFSSIFGMLLLICLAILSIVTKPRILLLSCIVLTIILGILDQSRWQPWVYQYLLMLVALGLFSWNEKDTTQQRIALNICRLIIVSMYIYSGVQKMNPQFIQSVFPWFVEPIVNLFPGTSFLHSLGTVTPLIEVFIGVGLLTKRFRKLSIITACLMHLLILLIIGPLGHNWNSVVWPWNIALPILIVLLFWETKDVAAKEILWMKDSLTQKIVLILVGVLPALSFINAWDSYLSWALYSGNTNDAVIEMSDAAKFSLPESMQEYVIPLLVDQHMIIIAEWSFYELNVPPYPETRIYKKIAKSICNEVDDTSGITLVIHGKPTLFNRGIERRYGCTDL